MQKVNVRTDVMQETKDNRWIKCLEIIKDNVPQAQYDAWFEPIVYRGFDSKNTIMLEVPSLYFAETLEEKYAGILKPVFTKVFGNVFKLRYLYTVAKEPETNIEVGGLNKSTIITNKVDRAAQQPANPFEKVEYADIDPQLNPKYTFENYCGSMSNKLPVSIGKAIAADPNCKTFNPLFIFGPTGVGKTHLIEAIGIKIKENNPRSRVLYITAPVFERQYTTAVSHNKVNDFLNFYQSIDVLIVDDIQEFAGKTGTQNTFYHIFNHLHQNQKQLILSSDCRPTDMDGMMPRLISRFKWGMTVELYPPDYNLRREVLTMKAYQDGLSIPADVLDFIATNVTDSVRELEGIVVSLLAHATMLNHEITIDLARAVLANSVKVSKRQVTFELIAETVCSHYNIDVDLLYGKSRKREISDSRQLVMYLAKKHTQLSSTNIGLRLSRNHATVLHACKNIEERLTVEKELREELEKIDNEFKK